MPAIFLAAPGSTFTPAPDWHYSFEYAIERERGLDAQEDLFTPGHFSLSLSRGARIAVIASVDDPTGRDGLALLDAERRRRKRLFVAEVDRHRTDYRSAAGWSTRRTKALNSGERSSRARDWAISAST